MLWFGIIYTTWVMFPSKELLCITFATLLIFILPMTYIVFSGSREHSSRMLEMMRFKLCCSCKVEV
jgi:hypothetical protein